MELSSSQTKENLMRAFAGESMARNRYTYAAATAKKEGHAVLAALFSYTAGQEKEHGEIFYEYLRACGCENVDLSAGYPVDLRGDIQSLLRDAVAHERAEQADIYPAFADAAKGEGFAEIAQKFSMIAAIEGTHAARFGRFLTEAEQGKLYLAQQETGWVCLNCGFVSTTIGAPKECPVCGHAQGWFIRLELAPYQS